MRASARAPCRPTSRSASRRPRPGTRSGTRRAGAISVSRLCGICTTTGWAGVAIRFDLLQIDRRAASPQERLLVGIDGYARSARSRAGSRPACSGIKPFWKAKPSMNRLVAIESPSRAVAMRVASMKCARPPTDSLISARISSTGNCQSGFWANWPGGCWCSVDHRHRAPGARLGDGIVRARGQHVAAENQVGFAGGDALGADAGRRARRCERAK